MIFSKICIIFNPQHSTNQQQQQQYIYYCSIESDKFPFLNN